jgi:putative ABC transport system permease protein
MANGTRLSFASLILHNLGTRPVRTVLTVMSVAVGITTIVALGVLTHSLQATAVSVLRTGKADFTVAQAHVDDVLNSSLTQQDIDIMSRQPGVGNVVGVLIHTDSLSDSQPFFLEVGITPEDQAQYGVDVVAGRSYTDTAPDEMMLGVRASQNLGKQVGDTMQVADRSFTIVGIFTTGIDIGDAGGMFALPTLQEWERVPGTYTLAFVQVAPGADIAQVRQAIETAAPNLATVQSETDFGRVDRNLVLLEAANLGGTILAVVVGAMAVLSTSLLSFSERIREFGVMRAVGWSRRRVLALVLSEAALVSLAGGAVGLALGSALTYVLRDVGALRGVFEPDFTGAIFGRALILSFFMAFAGALYPALRAAFISPLKALRRE